MTGGAAFTKLKGDFTFTDNCGDIANCNGPGGPNAAEAVSISKTKTGWTVGAGVEAALWSKWTLKGEYLYLDFGSISGVGLISLRGSILSQQIIHSPTAPIFEAISFAWV